MTHWTCPHEPEHMVHIHDPEEGPVAPSDSFEDNTITDRYDCDPECAPEGFDPG